MINGRHPQIYYHVVLILFLYFNDFTLLTNFLMLKFYKGNMTYIT